MGAGQREGKDGERACSLRKGGLGVAARQRGREHNGPHGVHASAVHIEQECRGAYEALPSKVGPWSPQGVWLGQAVAGGAAQKHSMQTLRLAPGTKISHNDTLAPGNSASKPYNTSNSVSTKRKLLHQKNRQEKFASQGDHQFGTKLIRGPKKYAVRHNLFGLSSNVAL